MGSCSNVNGGGGRQQQGQQQQQHPQLDPAFAQRTFSEAFHSFVEDSCRLEAEARSVRGNVDILVMFWSTLHF